MSANPFDTPTQAVGAEQSTAPGRGELGALLRAESARTQAAAAAVVLAKIVTVDAEGSVQVQLAGTPQPRPARLGAPLSARELAAAAAAGVAAILAFENGDPTLPIVMGLMRAGGPASEHGGAEPGATQAQAGAAHGAKELRAQGIDAQVDGRRVRIVGQDEIVLECGSASITLRRNGRVVIRGDYVETYSEGTNRIKGGQVRIN